MSAYLFRVPTETNAVVMLAGPEELQFNASGESHSVMRSNVLNMQLRPDRSLADKDIADDDSLPGRYLAKYHVSLVLADLSLIEKEVVAVSSRQSAVIGTADALPNLPESVVSRIGGGLSGIEVPSASVLGVGRPRCVGRVSIRDTKLEHAREILLHTDRHGCELASKVGQLLYPDGAESSPILKAGVL